MDTTLIPVQDVLPNDLIWTGRTFERVLHPPFKRTWGPKVGQYMIVLVSHASYTWPADSLVTIMRKETSHDERLG